MVSGKRSFGWHGKGSFEWHFSIKFQENRQGLGLVEGILIRKILNRFEFDFETDKESHLKEVTKVHLKKHSKGPFEGGNKGPFKEAFKRSTRRRPSEPFEGSHQPIRKRAFEGQLHIMPNSKNRQDPLTLAKVTFWYSWHSNGRYQHYFSCPLPPTLYKQHACKQKKKETKNQREGHMKLQIHSWSSTETAPIITSP